MPIVHAYSVSKSLPQKVFFPASGHYCLILLSVFRVGFDAQFHRLCYIFLAVQYRLMENLTTQKARVALGYRLGQLLRFFRALQTAHVLHNSIVHTEAWTNCKVSSRTWYLSSSSWLQELPRVAMRAYWKINRDRRARKVSSNRARFAHYRYYTNISHSLYAEGVLSINAFSGFGLWAKTLRGQYYTTRDPPHDSDKNYSPIERFCMSALSSRPENRAKKRKIGGLGFWLAKIML